VLLLPYLEQDNLYKQWDLRYQASKQKPLAYQTQVPYYLCPSRPQAVLSTGDFATPGGGLSDYAAVFGTAANGFNSTGPIIPVNGPYGTDSSGTAILLTWTPAVNLLSITDGTSNTLMFGEKHIRPNSLRGKNEDRSVFGGQNNSVRRMAGTAANGDQRPLRDPRDQNGALANTSFGGPHTGVCQFVLCDGSVRTVAVTTPLATLTALVGRSDGLIVNNY
jgi:hypothetical protein